MNATIIRSEVPQVVLNPTTGLGDKAGSLLLENSFAMLLGGMIQSNGENTQSTQLIGNLDDLIAQIDQLLAQLTGQLGVEEEDSSLFYENSLIDSLPLMFQVEDLQILLQMLSSQSSTEHSGTLPLMDLLTSNNFSFSNQSSLLANSVEITGQQHNQIYPHLQANPELMKQMSQQKDILQSIKSILLTAKEGQITVNQEDLNKLSQLVKQMTDGLNSKGDLRRGAGVEESKPVMFRGFDMQPITKVNSSSKGDTGLNTQSQPMQQEQASGDINVANTKTTKAGFHQLMMGSIQNQTTSNSQAPTNEPVVRAQHFHKDMNDFMVRQLQMTRFPNGVSEARIRLFPENLGAVEVRLSVQQGILTAQFFAETRAGKELLDSHLAGLRASLVSSGLQVEKLEVSMPNNSNNGQAQDSLNRQGNGQRDQQSDQTYQEDDVEEDFSAVFEEFSQVI